MLSRRRFSRTFIIAFYLFVALLLPRRLESGYEIEILGIPFPVLWLLGAILAMLFILSNFIQSPPYKIKIATIPLGLLLLWFLLNTLMNPNMTDYEDAFIGILLFFVPIAFIYSIYQNSLLSQTQLNHYRFIFLWLGSLYGFLAVISSLHLYFLGPYKEWDSSLVEMAGIGLLVRSSLPIGGANTVGAILLLTFPIIITEWATQSSKKRFRYFVGIIACALGLLSTFSRGPLIIAGIQSIFLFGRLKKRKKGIMFVLILLLILASFGGYLNTRIGGIGELFHPEQYEQNAGSSLDLRFRSFIAASDYVIHNPFWGSGIGTILSRKQYLGTVGNQTIYIGNLLSMNRLHSLFMTVAFETGVLGLSLLVVFFVQLLIRINKAQQFAESRNSNMAITLYGYKIAFLGIFLWLFISDAPMYQFRFATVLWFFVGLLLIQADSEINFAENREQTGSRKTQLTKKRRTF